MTQDIKTFELVLDEDDLGIFAISFVEKPAIKENFIWMNDEHIQKFAIESEEQRIVFGPILIPDIRIFRSARPEQGLPDHYVYFTKETIKKAQERYAKNKIDIITLGHKNETKGAFMLEHFIIDDRMTLVQDWPKGSWVGSFKIEDETLWTQIKEGTFKGFSIEAELSQKTELSEDLELKYFEDLYVELIKLKNKNE